MIDKGVRNKLTFDTIEANAGLKAAVKKTGADVIAELTASALKGRGGAGFPTGLKWKFALENKGDKKYVLCNADEGEPGTFKDRLLLMDYADLVFEGMTLGGFAIGAKKGILYLRGEYRSMLPQLNAILEKRRKDNLLGDKILGKKDFNFDIEIRLGSGAYICGEETALIESMEGFRGEPRNRPPYPADFGYHTEPSIVNNVETFAWAACVMAKGADWFKKIGTEKSAGPKLFSISGDCEKPGIYEFPFGITVKQLLKEAGGEGAKAVQIGGASGCCVPPSEYGRKIGFEDIATGGSVIVIGKNRDMLDVAENFLEFFEEESCGQCTPCREGNPKLLEGCRMLKEGRCSMDYLKELVSLGETMQIASKCGLGQTSPNAFLLIVKNFSNEIMGRTSDGAFSGKGDK